MTPGMLCALTCTSYRLHACTGVPRTFVWSLWVCRERPVSRSAVGRAGGGNQARDTGRRRSARTRQVRSTCISSRGGARSCQQSWDTWNSSVASWWGHRLGGGRPTRRSARARPHAVKRWSSPSSRATTIWLIGVLLSLVECQRTLVLAIRPLIRPWVAHRRPDGDRRDTRHCR